MKLYVPFSKDQKDHIVSILIDGGEYSILESERAYIINMCHEYVTKRHKKFVRVNEALMDVDNIRWVVQVQVE